MKKIGIYFLLIVYISTVAWAGGSNEDTKDRPIIIMHNKVEIDAQLKEFAEVFRQSTGMKVVVKTCGGDSCSLTTQLRADINAGEAPDIFVIDGKEGYQTWSEYIDDLSDESWTQYTDVGFEVDDKIVGFPIAIEGWGMGYNAQILDMAGIDPALLTNYHAYKAAFEELDDMKEVLGLDSVVSMTAGSGMHWVTSHHNINSYLSNGLARNDLSVVEKALEGKVEKERLREYVMWVKLLFDYSDQRVLVAGDYDAQVNAFATQKAAFIHQGNWIEPNLANANVTFPRAYAPHGSSFEDTDGVFVNPPTWYVVNKYGNASKAKAFLRFMAETPQGHDYMVNKIQAIPAFTNVSLTPKAPLSASLLEWVNEGKTYAWNQYYLPGDFRDNVLGPLFEQFAKKELTEDQFVVKLTETFATLQ